MNHTIHYFGAFLLSVFTQATIAQIDVSVKWTNKSDMPYGNVIYYHERPSLTWKDFTGSNHEPGRTAALTVSGFGYKADLGLSGDKGSLVVHVYCYFDKQKSWVKADKKSAYILNHEQKHFDISYVAANVFISLIKKATFTPENFNNLLGEIYDESCTIMSKLQLEYDSQTSNGLDTSEQEKWNAKILREIASFTD